MDDCIFCQVINGKLPGTFLYRDPDVVIFKDINPQAPVHWLVVSTKHVSEFIEADDVLIAKMMSVIKKVIVDEKITPYRLVNNGKGAAVVDHLHVHILGSVDKLRKL